MNRIYAVLIMFYCWHKTHSQDYIDIQQYHAPGHINHNQSIPRLALTYQQILRKLVLPYHHQLPYCYHLPTAYYQNETLQEVASRPPQYLLFYYNSYYHQSLPSNNLEPLESLTDPLSYNNVSFEPKPSSGILLFYHNTFYHQNSYSNYDGLNNIHESNGHFMNESQENGYSWKTTRFTLQQEGWSYGKILALASTCIAGNYKTASKSAQNINFNPDAAFDSFHFKSLEKRTFACSLLSKLLSALSSDMEWTVFPNQTYELHEELNDISLSLKIEKLTSSTSDKNFKNGGNDKRYKLGNLMIVSMNDSENEFTIARNTFQQLETKHRNGAPKCSHVFRFGNETYNNKIITFASAHPKITLNFNNQSQISENKSYSEPTENILDFQDQHKCPIMCTHAQMCCK